ncbi:hypothetical protein SCUCBS95973_008962 [Sporothrix curviconia]|uniref:Phytase-like domain-containing protein n=1 Tax=Sporothrix curviconia TaxID=1260050 RepID=A0ABP0CQV8_9PEZI
MLSTALLVVAGAATAVRAACTPKSVASATVCGGKTYVYEQLAGFGYVSSSARDKYGDTIGGHGSAIALDLNTWTRDASNGNRYTGILHTLPDRGWNTEGTLNFVPRIHKFEIELTIVSTVANATNATAAPPNLKFTYLDSVLLTGPDGQYMTGLDADGSGTLSYDGFPPLPVSTYTGNGFGDGPFNVTSKHIPLDSEGLVLNADGSYWVSDEYGPYVYHFSSTGRMLSAIRPPEAFIPKRNGSDSFSADSQFFYINNGTGDDVSPADNPTGRDNNHGFEGLSVTEDGKTLFVFLQAAANQEGGLGGTTERWSRLLKYDVSTPSAPIALGEYVVPLPLYDDPTKKASKNPQVAAQSEIHVLPNGQLFVLPRDSNAGRGQSVTTSQYRHIDVIDLTGAENILGNTFDCATCAIADLDGNLNSTITNATLCPFLDFNDNSELARFGMHNGGNQDDHLLNEKWESIALAPVYPGTSRNEYFVFSLSDNDFITQNGTLNFGQFHYADSSGYNLANQALVFKVLIPN